MTVHKNTRESAKIPKYFEKPDYGAVEAVDETLPVTRSTRSPRLHGATYLYLLASGRLRWRLNGKSHPVSPGDLVVMPAGCPYDFDVLAPSNLLLLRFRQRAFAPVIPGELDAWREWVQRARQAIGGHPVQALSPGTDYRRLVDHWREAARENAARLPGGPTMMKALGLYLLGLLQRLHPAEEMNRPPLPAGLLAVLVHLEQEAAQPHPVGDLARLAGMSRSLLYARFRENLGMSPVDYLTRLRISDACARLVGTDDTVLAVGLAAGFNSPSRFYQAFQEQTGLSPGAFRARHRRKA